MRQINFKILIGIFFSVFFLLPFLVKADKDTDSREICILQNKIEKRSYSSGEDSICVLNYSKLKALLDEFIITYTPNKQYVKSSILYAKFISKGNPLEAVSLLHELNDICIDKQYDTLQAFVSQELGSVYFKNDLLTEALSIFSQSVEYFHKIGDNASYAYTLIDIGNIYFRKRQFKNSRKYYIKTKKIFQGLQKKSDRDWGSALAYNNIGETYMQENKFDSSLFYFRKAFEIRKKNQLKSAYYVSYSSFLSLYDAMGNIDSALFYAQKSIDITKELKLKNELSFSYFNYATIALTIDTSLSIRYLQEAIDINMGKDANVLFRIYKLLIKIYLVKDIDSAFYHTKAMFNIAHETQNPRQIKFSASTLSKIYHQKGNYKEEAKYLKVLNDVILNSKSKEIYKEELAFEKKQWKKQTELYQANQQKNSIISYFQTATIILILVFLFFIFLGRKKLKIYAQKLKESNIQLEELNKNRDTIYSIIAHDLRSPVGTSLALIDMMENNKIEENSFIEILPTMKKSLKGTYNLLENLLSWAHLNKHNIKLSYTEMALRNLVEEIKNILNETAQSKKIEILNQIDETITVTADHNSISTVLRNLISNAIKFSFEDSKIIINAKDYGDKVEISVQDFGMGIDAETKKKMFYDNNIKTTAGTKNERGSGLGLLLCKEFVALNGGKIWVKSNSNGKGENKGSTFYFTLPKTKNR